MTTLNNEEITLCSEQCFAHRGSICLWVSMTTLSSEEITLCSDSVLHIRGSNWLSIWMTTLNSKEITLWSDSVDWGVHLPLSLDDNIEQWRDHSVLWQCFAHRQSICVLVWMTTLNSEEITLCSNCVHWGVHLPLSLNDNIEQWRDHSVLWQCFGGSPPAYESGWQHWTVMRSLCALTVLTGGSLCLWVWMTTLNSEEITLCSDSVDWGVVHLPLSLNDNIEHWRDQSVFWQCFAHRVSLYLWVWMKTLNSEEITLCSDSVLGGPSVFQSQWLHWTVKRSLCAQTVLKGILLPLRLNDNIEQWRDHSVLWQCFAHRGLICLWVWMTTLNSEVITLCSDSVWPGGESICLWVSMTTLNSEEITLCSDSVDWGVVHLPLSLNDNIEQWRDHSVFWQCFAHRVSLYLWVWMTTLNSEEITLCSDSVLGGPSVFQSQWLHWTVKRSLCAQTVLKGFLLPFSLNDNIKQWRDQSVLWLCWPGGSICLWVWMTTLNSEEITLCSDSVERWSICLWV